MEGFQIIQPAPLLSNFIEHYFFVDITKPIHRRQFIRVIPQGVYEFVINYKVNYVENSKNGDSIVSPYTLIGPSVKYKDFGVAGEIGFFTIVFKPYGLYMLSDISSNYLAKNYTPIDLISRQLDELKNRLLDADNNIQRVYISNSFLTSLFLKKQTKHRKHRIPIEYVIRKIKENKGCININALANDCFCSLSKFERNFKDYIGTTPKEYARIVRFNEAINVLNIENYEKLHDFIFKMGYYDQSHFINEFKKFMGTTPKHYIMLRNNFNSDYYLIKNEFKKLNKMELILS